MLADAAGGERRQIENTRWDWLDEVQVGMSFQIVGGPLLYFNPDNLLVLASCNLTLPTPTPFPFSLLVAYAGIMVNVQLIKASVG